MSAAVSLRPTLERPQPPHSVARLRVAPPPVPKRPRGWWDDAALDLAEFLTLEEEDRAARSVSDFALDDLRRGLAKAGRRRKAAELLLKAGCVAEALRVTDDLVAALDHALGRFLEGARVHAETIGYERALLRRALSRRGRRPSLDELGSREHVRLVKSKLAIADSVTEQARWLARDTRAVRTARLWRWALLGGVASLFVATAVLTVWGG
jgi:hypothetical protein